MSVIPHCFDSLPPSDPTINYIVHHNAQLPLYSLPLEVFTHCLALSMTDSFQDYFTCLKGLALVCKYWMTVVHSTPHLWSIVSSEMPEAHVRLALKRSRNAPLDVYIEYSYDYSAIRTFTQNVANHLLRWRSLIIRSTDDDDLDFHLMMASYLGSPTPTLRNLRLVWNGPITTIALTGGPPLRSVSLDHVALPWDSPRLTGLTDLSLSDLSSSYAPTLIHLLQMIESSPALEHLKLLDVAADDSEELTPSSWWPIELPHLRTLYLSGLSPAVSTVLIARLRVPYCESIRLRFNPGPSTEMLEDVISWNRAVPGFASDVNRVLGRETHVQVVFGERNVSLTTGEEGGPQNLWLYVELDRGAQMIPVRLKVLERMGKWLDAVCPNAAAVALHVLAGPPQCLDVFSVATRLKFTCDELPSFMRHLAQRPPSDAASGRAQWPCPRLTALDLSQTWEYCGYQDRQIRGWVKDRWVSWDEARDQPSHGVLEVTMPSDGMGSLALIQRWHPV